MSREETAPGLCRPKLPTDSKPVRADVSWIVHLQSNGQKLSIPGSGLCGSAAPDFSFSPDWCRLTQAFLWPVSWPFLPAIAQLLGPSLCPTGPGWAPLPPASHRPDPKSQFPARLLAFHLFKTFFFSPIYLISAPILRSGSNPSTSKQSVLTTLGQGYLLLLTNPNCGDHILP